jgi:hypothetical protein
MATRSVNYIRSVLYAQGVVLVGLFLLSLYIIIDDLSRKNDFLDGLGFMFGTASLVILSLVAILYYFVLKRFVFASYVWVVGGSILALIMLYTVFFTHILGNYSAFFETIFSVLNLLSAWLLIRDRKMFGAS